MKLLKTKTKSPAFYMLNILCATKHSNELKTAKVGVKS